MWFYLIYEYICSNRQIFQIFCFFFRTMNAIRHMMIESMEPAGAAQPIGYKVFGK